MNIATPSVAAKRSFSKELNMLKANQQLLTILVLLFICMVFWIIIALLSSQTRTKITPELLEMAKPFNPTLNTEVLDSLESKQVFTEEELANFPIFIIQKSETDQTETIVELGTGTPATTPAPTVAPVTTPNPTPPAETGNVDDTL